MAFNSVDFLLFFPVVVLIYFAIPQKVRYIWLLLASYFFYMKWNAKYALLLFFSTAVTYLSGYLIHLISNKVNQTSMAKKLKIGCVCGSLFLNLSVLFLFKYYNFFVSNVNSVLKATCGNFYLPSFDFLLPVGISFYTFQALSYTIDVYRGDVEPEKNFFRYALFVSFFPQLVAGPIERSKNLLKQLQVPHTFQYDRAFDGILIMIWGYFQKLVIADRVAIIVNTVYSDVSTYGGWYLVIASGLFAIQIYCDFAGYSTIAKGAAQIMGFQLMDNFNAPYFSKSVSEFWRRWHISLSSWFKDYLYIPLGGNRKGKKRKYFNLMIVFLVSGIWHGASWNFAVWGGINGLYQIAGKELQPLRNRIVALFGLHRESLAHRCYKVLTTFVLIDISWIFFRADTFSQAITILKSILYGRNIWILFDDSLFNLGLSYKGFSVMLVALAVLFIADLLKYKGVNIRGIIAAQDYWARAVCIVASVSFILLFGIWGNEYNAASFIYFQF